jgi:multidrug resistance efflux pump
LAELEREVRQLRAEVEKLQQELKELKAARFVAPQYGEALALAQRGFSAQQIADRMGIALAEAELVLALSRGESAFAEGKLDEAIDLEQQGE